MTDYTKITDFSAKDALASGAPEKLAVGADVDAEFDALATMSATKEDKSNKGAASGYCPLDGSADVADANIPAHIMRTNTAQTNAAGKGDAYVTLVDGTTVDIDCSEGNSFTLTLGGDRTINAPTNPLDGQTIVIDLVQDATGTRTVTWNAIFLWPSGTAPTLTTTPLATDIVTGKYNSTTAAWRMVVSGLDFS